MPRIAGVDIPNDKQIIFALTYIHGIGRHLSGEILKEAQINQDLKAKELNDDELSRIAGILDRDYVIEGQLRRQTSQDIARLRDISCYRGLRHRRGLRAGCCAKPHQDRCRLRSPLGDLCSIGLSRLRRRPRCSQTDWREPLRECGSAR